MQDASVVEWIGQKYDSLWPAMNERMRRRWAATEALSLGWGGVTTVAVATGLTRKTIHFGIRELEAEAADPGLTLPPDRVRRVGAVAIPRRSRFPGALPQSARDCSVFPRCTRNQGTQQRPTHRRVERVERSLCRRGSARNHVLTPDHGLTRGRCAARFRAANVRTVPPGRLRPGRGRGFSVAG